MVPLYSSNNSKMILKTLHLDGGIMWKCWNEIIAHKLIHKWLSL